MAYSTPWQELHRWADDGGAPVRPRKTTISQHQRHWLRQRNYLDAIRRETGRHEGYPHRRLEVSR